MGGREGRAKASAQGPSASLNLQHYQKCPKDQPEAPRAVFRMFVAMPAEACPWPGLPSLKSLLGGLPW